MDSRGNIYMSAKNEGVVVFDSNRRYKISLGYPTFRDGALPLNENNQPVESKPGVAQQISDAYVSGPDFLAVDARGNLYVVDQFKVKIYRRLPQP